MDALVVVHLLMSDVKVFVAPLRLGHLTIKNESTNQLLFASKSLWSIHRIHIVQVGVGRNRLDLRNKSHWVIAWEFGWEQGVNIGVRLESQREREHI